MEGNTPADQQPAQHTPTGPPELKKSVKTDIPTPRVPQLVRSTKSTITEPNEPVSFESSSDPEWFQTFAEPDEASPMETPVKAREDVPVRQYGDTSKNIWYEDDQLNEHVEEPGDPDGINAAHEAETKHTTTHEPIIKVRKRHPILKTFVVLFIIVAATIGVYAYGSYKGTPKTKSTSTNHVTKKVATSTKVSIKQYASTNYSLTLSYPSNWTLNDTDTALTLLSPANQLINAEGERVATRVVLTIHHQQSTITGYPADGATATLNSDKLTYTNPTAIQRAQTYVSYLGYNTTTALDALYISGDNGYLNGQNVPMSDLINADPLISVGFLDCPSSDCTSTTPTAITLKAADWQATSVSKAVTTILESIELN